MARIKARSGPATSASPRPATYGDDADQWRFLVSATHILSQSMGAQPSESRRATTNTPHRSATRSSRRPWPRLVSSRLYIPGTVDKDIEGDTSDVATPDNSVDVARAKVWRRCSGYPP